MPGEAAVVVTLVDPVLAEGVAALDVAGDEDGVVWLWLL